MIKGTPPWVKLIICCFLFFGFTHILLSESNLSITSHIFAREIEVELPDDSETSQSNLQVQTEAKASTNPSKHQENSEETVIVVDKVTPVSCADGNDGAIEITVTGGTGPYTYLWSGNGRNDTSEDISNLSTGSYTVTVSDLNSSVSSIFTVSEPEILSANVTNTQPSCYGTNNGSINISSPAGGYGTYQYSINGGSTWTAGLSNPDLAPGNYDIRIRDAANTACVIDLGNQVITAPAILSATVISTNVTCNGANDGTISVTNPQGGYGTFQYSINNGGSWQDTGNFSNLNNATYQVVIRDKANINCTITLDSNLTITQPQVLSATLTSTNMTCNGANNGTISVTNPLGGYGTYQYSINNGGSWQDTGNFSNLNNATYQVVIRDAANTNCTTTLNSNLTITQPQVLNATVTSKSVTCNGANDGTISIANPQGGYGTFQYSINNGGIWKDSGEFSGLSNASYQVVIRDKANNGCSITLNPNLTITQPAVLNATVIQNNVTCFGGSNGSISVNNSSGGYGTYHYSINNGSSWQDSGDFTGLIASTYNVLIQDIANPDCTVDLRSGIIITQPPLLNGTVSSTNVTCNGSNDGSITISNPSGGFGTYQYSTNNGNNWQDSGYFTALSNGDYKVLIRDKAHPECFVILNEALFISQPELLQMEDPIPTVISCFGGNTGNFTVGATSGGNGDYLYSIDNVNFQSATTFSGLTSGIYTIFVKDTNGCASQKQVELTQVEKLNVTISKTEVLCNAGNSGKIILSNPIGGSGNFEYRIGSQSWQTSLTFENLIAGSYSVFIRDKDVPTCVIDLPPVQITQPADSLSTEVTSTRTTIHGTSSGSASASPSGGSAPYTYEWRKKDENPVLQYTQVASNLPSGWYTVTVIDKNNCKVQKDIRVIEKVTAEIIAPSVCENINNDYRTSTFSVDYDSVLGGFEDPSKYTYTWQFGAGIHSITQVGDKYKVQYNTGGDKIITLNITDQANIITTLTFQHYVGECFEGCGSSNNFTVDQDNFYFGDINGTPVNGDNCVSTAEIYLWVNITKSSNIYTITGEIEYNVNDGTQTFSRKASQCFGTLISGTPGGNGNNNKPVYSQIETGLFKLFKVEPGSNNGTSINWSCGQTFDIEKINLRYTNQENKECGDNSQNMCIGLTENIIVSTPIIASTVFENIKCNGTNTGLITINASGGIKPYKYSRTGNVIDGYQDSNIFLNIPAGTYSNLWIKDFRDRTFQLPTVVITAPPILESSVTNQVNSLCYGELGEATVEASGGTPFSSGEPYKYLWNNGATTATVNNLAAGTYTVTVIDANNCQSLKQVTITQPEQLTLPNAGPDQIFNCGFTMATLSANAPSVGTGNWNIYSGEGGVISNVDLPNATFTGVPGNKYTLHWTISNSPNTCSDFDAIEIEFATDCSTLDFDGVDDYVTFGNNYGFTSGSFTLETWVKLKSTTGTKTVLSKRNSASSTNNGYELIINSGAPTFRWGNNVITTSHSLNTSRWYHLAVIFDGTQASLYVDGIFMSNGMGNNPSTNSHPFLIGAAFDAGQPQIPRNYFHGWIEEVRLWKAPLSEDQLRFMMNQRLQDGNGTDLVRGEILPLDVPSGLTWDKLEGYYRLFGDQVTGGLTTDLASVKISGQVKNVISKQQNTAPLPYKSRVNDQTWGTDNTWEHWEVRDVPNSNGINGNPINWNIVEIDHNISSGGNDITVLGLKSNTIGKLLQIGAPGVEDENNPGQMLRVTHYLYLNGNIDLVGKSQLLQDEESVLDNDSKGWLEIGQQGTKSSYNYNYWSSPVSIQQEGNNSGYSVGAVLRNPKGIITYSPNPYAADNTPPTAANIIISSYWLNAFYPATANDYSKWEPISHDIKIKSGEGFTMKGTSGAAPISQKQTYSFRGKPHNGTILLRNLSENQNYLIGNPYPSAIDAHKFIEDNINDNDENIFDGSLYFWDHYGGSSHILKEYVGGYAVINLTSPEGVSAASTDERINNTVDFGSTKKPGQFIPVGQAFLINSTNPDDTSTATFGGTIQFKNNQRVYKREGLDNYSIFLKPETDKISPEIKNGATKRIRLSFKSPIGYNRQILAGAIAVTTSGFDLGYDANLFDYNVEDMYWIQDKNYLVIQGVPNFDPDQVLKLGVRIKENKPFRIKLDTLENGVASMKIYLNDKLQDSIHDLRESPYISSSEPGEINDRFEINFYKEEPALPVTTPGEVVVEVPEGTELTIRHGQIKREIQILNPLQIPILQVQIFDITGNLLEVNREIPGLKDVRLPVRNYSTGVYIVKLFLQDRILSKKIIIKN